mmetsp:Transcript_30040/g.96912  ORF Transcript_30040/g.96912 Transcript_30040/m.96912 type:complete len:318 (+) Transcript_30040:799-1752(+)
MVDVQRQELVEAHIRRAGGRHLLQNLVNLAVGRVEAERPHQVGQLCRRHAPRYLPLFDRVLPLRTQLSVAKIVGHLRVEGPVPPAVEQPLKRGRAGAAIGRRAVESVGVDRPHVDGQIRPARGEDPGAIGGHRHRAHRARVRNQPHALARVAVKRQPDQTDDLVVRRVGRVALRGTGHVTTHWGGPIEPILVRLTVRLLRTLQPPCPALHCLPVGWRLHWEPDHLRDRPTVRRPELGFGRDHRVHVDQTDLVRVIGNRHQHRSGLRWLVPFRPAGGRGRNRRAVRRLVEPQQRRRGCGLLEPCGFFERQAVLRRGAA